jgi:hypothetical protein
VTEQCAEPISRRQQGIEVDSGVETVAVQQI